MRIPQPRTLKSQRREKKNATQVLLPITPVGKMSRNTLSRPARRFRNGALIPNWAVRRCRDSDPIVGFVFPAYPPKDYTDVFGYDLPKERVKQLYKDILQAAGLRREQYAKKNLQNWLSNKRKGEEAPVGEQAERANQPERHRRGS